RRRPGSQPADRQLEDGVRLERDATEALLVPVELIRRRRDAIGWRGERRYTGSIERDRVNLRERVPELRGQRMPCLGVDVFSQQASRQRFAFDEPDEEELAAQRVVAEQKRLRRR